MLDGSKLRLEGPVRIVEIYQPRDSKSSLRRPSALDLRYLAGYLVRMISAKSSTRSALDRLAGASSCEALASGGVASRLAASGYEAAYPCDLFTSSAPEGCPGDEASALFCEPGASYRFRSFGQLCALKDALAAEGLGLLSAHFPETLPPPGEAAERVFEAHDRFVEIAAKAGLSFLTTHVGAMFASPPGPPGASLTERCRLALDAYGRRKAFEDSVVVYRRLCREAAKRGISVSVETCCAEMPETSGSPSAVMDFIAAVGAGNLGVCFDAGHCNVRGIGLKRAVELFGSRLLEIHAHDNFGLVDSHSPLGEGSVDWPGLVEALRLNGYSGLVTFEQGAFERNASFWRALLK